VKKGTIVSKKILRALALFRANGGKLIRAGGGLAWWTDNGCDYVDS
jgi:hypothetical protein